MHIFTLHILRHLDPLHSDDLEDTHLLFARYSICAFSTGVSIRLLTRRPTGNCTLIVHYTQLFTSILICVFLFEDRALGKDPLYHMIIWHGRVR
ncbi:uncharacterized protein LY89DRAFT_115133 [Mollisia scopiformis]|uniref:Uncharacterized protein n=1 Tax=Mollisia scopiformis TaxID=149040 RepID=A0A194X5R2_MOLSC|nr:uncharacterized protein LY89DRAFT_115133 [Mollisia scopiformis]KUJ15511.1 hypothetical protein LY89DRAFT_115133 [Mollisia scopiformis]